MNKHAYLIMAHGNWKILKELLLLLDDERNDIYLHIDAKVSDFPWELESIIQNSNLKIIDSTEVYWADFSQVIVTLKLMEAARKEGYSYYHLLSGSDLPLKSNNEIYNFFENSGKEFIGIVPKEVYYSVRRVKFYHLLLHNQYYRRSKTLKVLDRIFEYIQSFLGINRLQNNNWKIIDGWTWFSITNDFCNYVLERKEDIYKIFSHSIASDELFIQTLAYNSEFYKQLYDTSDLKNGSMRFIDWKRGKPYTWGAENGDFEMLLQSPYMFARKFDEEHEEIAEKIFEEIDRRNKNDKRTIGMEDQTSRN